MIDGHAVDETAIQYVYWTTMSNISHSAVFDVCVDVDCLFSIRRSMPVIERGRIPQQEVVYHGINLVTVVVDLELDLVCRALGFPLGG
jgi:hypothetical protein